MAFIYCSAAIRQIFRVSVAFCRGNLILGGWSFLHRDDFNLFYRIYSFRQGFFDSLGLLEGLRLFDVGTRVEGGLLHGLFFDGLTGLSGLASI